MVPPLVPVTISGLARTVAQDAESDAGPDRSLPQTRRTVCARSGQPWTCPRLRLASERQGGGEGDASVATFDILYKQLERGAGALEWQLMEASQAAGPCLCEIAAL